MSHTDGTDDFLQPTLVDFIESVKFTAVNIENSCDIAIVIENRDNNFRAGEAATGNMTREFLYIRDNHCGFALPGCATDTTAERDVHASHAALERP